MSRPRSINELVPALAELVGAREARRRIQALVDEAESDPAAVQRRDDARRRYRDIAILSRALARSWADRDRLA